MPVPVVNYAKSHKIGGSRVEEKRLGEQHPDIFAINSRLAVDLAGGVFVSDRCYPSSFADITPEHRKTREDEAIKPP
jgi:hypothetical protein